MFFDNIWIHENMHSMEGKSFILTRYEGVSYNLFGIDLV